MLFGTYSNRDRDYMLSPDLGADRKLKDPKLIADVIYKMLTIEQRINKKEEDHSVYMGLVSTLPEVFEPELAIDVIKCMIGDRKDQLNESKGAGSLNNTIDHILYIESLASRAPLSDKGIRTYNALISALPKLHLNDLVDYVKQYLK